MDQDTFCRLAEEYAQVISRLHALDAYMLGAAFPVLPQEDKDMICAQRVAMGDYVSALRCRINITVDCPMMPPPAP